MAYKIVIKDGDRITHEETVANEADILPVHEAANKDAAVAWIKENVKNESFTAEEIE